MTEFTVDCPRCQHEAVISTGSPYSFENARLTCSHCNHSEKAVDLIFYKMSVRAHCDNCGKGINKVIPHSKEKVDGFAISCAVCGATRIYRARNEEYSRTYDKGLQGADPIFGLPLRLQSDVKGNLLWAYNRLHLREIKTYVKARLRERQTTTHTTMVERLPTFVTEAKNREAVLKAIEKMERL
jgi:transcription elongation factor Elf1